MDIYFLTLILLVINRLIVDTQTQVSGILFFNDQEQNISIWIRPQPTFIKEGENQNQVIPNAIINDRDGLDILTFAYDIMDQSIFIFAETQYEKFYFFNYVNKFGGSLLYLPWIKLIICKSKENLEYIKHDEKPFALSNMKLQPFSIYCWQSTYFSCQIYDQIQKFTDSFLVFQNDIFIKRQYLRIFNFRQQILLIIYFKFFKTQIDLPLILIRDQDWNIYIRLNSTNIIIEFNYGYQKLFTEAFYSNMANQWIGIIFQNKLEQIQCVLGLKDRLFEQNIQYVEDYGDAFSLPKILAVTQYIQQYKIYIINKIIDDFKDDIDNFCFQNCKICKFSLCLECEGQLSLEDNCQCPVNQYYNPILGFCVDKTLSQNIRINHNYDLQQCSFGLYYDQNNLKCTECPKLNEFYCSACLYNTIQWQQDQYCDYQDIYQQIFISPELNYEFTEYLLSPIKKQTNIYIRQDDDSKRILYSRDIYRIYWKLCEQNYFFNSELNKCKNLQKGQQYGIFGRGQILELICKIGYSNLSKCIKCQKNCLFCKFFNHSLRCILPNQSYTLNQNLQIIKCNDEYCQEIQNQNFDECQIDNCLVCYFSACLVCNHKYVQEFYNGFCRLGSKYSTYLHIQINDNLIKPQFNYEQILYLRYQVDKNKIDLNYQETIQLLVFGNNYKNLRLDQLTQQQNVLYVEDNQQVYCLNQTYYFKNRFCHQHVPGYQYIQQLQIYVYCYNENCQFDLIYKVTVLYSNIPSIQYKNMTFLNFKLFALSLSIDDLFIKNIIIEAVVYVFDTFQNNCEHAFFFNISDLKGVNFQITLDFQGVSVFPSCQKILTIDFDEVQLINLFTYSSIQIQLTCNKVLINNCTFLDQEDFLLNIEASHIQLKYIYIEGILKEQVQHIVNFYNPQVIENITIINFYVGNVSISEEKNVINICSKANQTYMGFVKLENSKLIKQSAFLSNYYPINFRIEFLIIDNIILEKSALILQMIPSNLLTINNLLIQNSQIGGGSFLIQAYTLKLFNISFTNLFIYKSWLINANENLIIQNILLKEIQLSQAQILVSSVNIISVIRFLIIDSQIINSQSLIEILANSFTFRFIYFLNCGYTPNIQWINIEGEAGTISSLMINNVTNVIDKEYELKQLVINVMNKNMFLSFIKFKI